MDYINNKDLIPRYLEDKYVNWEGDAPDWTKTLIMANCRIETVSTEGTFRAATRMLDHFAEMGVNCLWINPVFERTPGADKYEVTRPDGVRVKLINGYMFGDPSKLAPELGTEEDFCRFVKEAHKRNIRILLDVVPHGVNTDSHFITDKPEWFKRDENGEICGSWRMYDFDFNNQEVRQWYIGTTVDWIIKYDLDGLRVDVEPFVTGVHLLWDEVFHRLKNAGKKCVMISEHRLDDRGRFTFEELGVGNIPNDYATDARNYYLKNNIVEATKNGSAMGGDGHHRFYAFPLSTHDSGNYNAKGNIITFAYQMIFAPVIPLFVLGEEFNQTLKKGTGMYSIYTDWDKLDCPENRRYYEKVKQMIRIRRTYPEIFEFYPPDHTDSNICEVKTENGNLQAYMRYMGSVGIMVIPNYSDSELEIKCTVPTDFLTDMHGEYKLFDLIEKTEIKSQYNCFSVKVKANDMRVIKVSEE